MAHPMSLKPQCAAASLARVAVLAVTYAARKMATRKMGTLTDSAEPSGTNTPKVLVDGSWFHSHPSQCR